MTVATAGLGFYAVAGVFVTRWMTAPWRHR